MKHIIKGFLYDYIPTKKKTPSGRRIYRRVCRGSRDDYGYVSILTRREVKQRQKQYLPAKVGVSRIVHIHRDEMECWFPGEVIR